MISGQDIVLVALGCTVAGVLAGLIIIFYRRSVARQVDRAELFSRVGKLWRAITLARDPEVSIQENAEVADSLGQDWYDEHEWPEDPQESKLLVWISRVHRVEDALAELEDSINRYPMAIPSDALDVLNQFRSISSDLIESVNQAAQAGRLSKEREDSIYCLPESLGNDAEPGLELRFRLSMASPMQRVMNRLLGM